MGQRDDYAQTGTVPVKTGQLESLGYGYGFSAQVEIKIGIRRYENIRLVEIPFKSSDFHLKIISRRILHSSIVIGFYAQFSARKKLKPF